MSIRVITGTWVTFMKVYQWFWSTILKVKSKQWKICQKWLVLHGAIPKCWIMLHQVFIIILHRMTSYHSSRIQTNSNSNFFCFALKQVWFSWFLFQYQSSTTKLYSNSNPIQLLLQVRHRNFEKRRQLQSGWWNLSFTIYVWVARSGFDLQIIFCLYKTAR